MDKLQQELKTYLENTPINKRKFNRNLYTLSEKLLRVAGDKYKYDEPFLKLYVAIIVQAARDLDMEFFYSTSYRIYCGVLQLDPIAVRKLSEGYILNSFR